MISITADQILKQHDLVVVDHYIIDTAVEFAVLGEVDIARDFINTYFTETQGLTAHYRVNRPGLNFAWQITGEWPEHMPEKERTGGEDTASWNYNDKWKNLPAAAKEFTTTGLDEFLKLSEKEAGIEPRYCYPYERVQLVRALDMSLSIDATESNVAEEPASGGRRQTAALSDMSRDLLDRIADRLYKQDDKKQIEYLIELPRVWPFLIGGALARAVGVSSETLQNEAKMLKETFRQRLFEGRPRSGLEKKSMRELLELGNHNSIEGPGRKTLDEVNWEGKECKTVFKNPATPADVKALEERLGVALPEDYKEFLAISNGFAVDCSPSHGLFNGYHCDPALKAANEVDWVNEPWFEIPVQALGISLELEKSAWDGMTRVSAEGVMTWDTPLPLFTRIIDIGTEDIDNLWLVHPNIMKEARDAYYAMYDKGDERQKRLTERAMREFAGSREEFDEVGWGCADWASGGSASLTVYPSFRRYLEVTIEDGCEDKMRHRR